MDNQPPVINPPQSKTILPWKHVWKKMTTKLNVVMAAAAATYVMLPEGIRDDMSPWVVSPLAGLAVLNIFVGNFRQKNLPPPL